MKKKKIFYVIVFLSFFAILWCCDIIKYFFDKKMPIENIEITGYKIVSLGDIEEFFDDEIKNKNLLFFNPWNLQKKIMTHPLTQNVEIKKQYPNKLSIYFEEKEVVLLINNNKKNYILDKNDFIIEINENLIHKYSELANLLKIEGEDILDESREIAKIFLNKNYTKRIVGLYKIGKRRWDMIVDYKIKVMLPEVINDDYMNYAFNSIDKLKINDDVHRSAIYSIVDMRINNRIFVKNIDE